MGKGSSPRPVDRQKFGDNYDRIFRGGKTLEQLGITEENSQVPEGWERTSYKKASRPPVMFIWREGRGRVINEAGDDLFGCSTKVEAIRWAEQNGCQLVRDWATLEVDEELSR